MALSRQQQRELQVHLQEAVIACGERCLYVGAKWLAELLDSLPSTDEDAEQDGGDTDVDDDRQQSLSNHDPKEARLEAKELSRFLLAKSLFNCREYDRCASVFLPSPSPGGMPARNVLSPTKLHLHEGSGSSRPHQSSFRSKSSTGDHIGLPKNLSQRSLFLALYARYLAGEKRKNEDSETILGPADGPVTENHQVSCIIESLEDHFRARGGLQNLDNSQGWLDYLYGLVLVRNGSEALAKQWLLRSVNINPFNWSAWLELASLLTSQDDLRSVSEHLPRNIMTFFFHIHCSQELFQPTPQVFNMLAQMQQIFPSSAWLQQQRAVLHYHAREHETALQTFDELLKQYPGRLEGMDVFSNLLYIMPNTRPKLALLARVSSSIDKFRPETNCILGNYYSLISEHEKAVLHFRRALSLDRGFQAAWTLMGHEYIELKNTQAAIESYRRAVDINRKDYRAWYGLGQGYEMLECYSYSLHYYNQAASLNAGDPKMWAAVANAYSKCGKVQNAIQAYRRALVVGAHVDTGSSFGSSNTDPLAHALGGALDPQVLYEIALLYERESQWDEAAAYMELALEQEEGAEEGDEGLGVTQVTSKARLWLARWNYSCGEWTKVMELANELCQDGVEVEEAKSLIKDVRARLHLGDESEGA